MLNSIILFNSLNLILTLKMLRELKRSMSKCSLNSKFLKNLRLTYILVPYIQLCYVNLSFEIWIQIKHQISWGDLVRVLVEKNLTHFKSCSTIRLIRIEVIWVQTCSLLDLLFKQRSSWIWLAILNWIERVLKKIARIVFFHKIDSKF